MPVVSFFAMSIKIFCFYLLNSSHLFKSINTSATFNYSHHWDEHSLSSTLPSHFLFIIVKSIADDPGVFFSIFLVSASPIQSSCLELALSQIPDLSSEKNRCRWATTQERDCAMEEDFGWSVRDSFYLFSAKPQIEANLEPNNGFCFTWVAEILLDLLWSAWRC